MVAQPIVEAFSLTHVQVLDGETSFEDAIEQQLTDASQVAEDEDIYGVSEASISPNTGDFVNSGDNKDISYWSWFENAEVAVKSGFLSFPVYSRLTGQDYTISSLGGQIMFQADYIHEDSMNVSPLPAIIVMPSRDLNGAVRNLVIGLYRCQPKPITFDGPVIRDGLKVNYSLTALSSTVDELGNAHADGKGRVGKLISTY